MENQIIKYNNVKYLLQPNDEYNTVAYYQGCLGAIDFRFANPTDHINFDSNQKFDLPLKDVYLNSMNMNNTTFAVDQPLKNTVLHINMNNYHFDYNNKLRVNNKAFLQDLANFLPALVTKDNEQMFKAVSFENMSFALSTTIKELCDKANIQSYGMVSDETARQGYCDYANAKSRVQHLNIKPVGLKNTQKGLNSGTTQGE